MPGCFTRSIGLASGLLILAIGCDTPDPIVRYAVPTRVPTELQGEGQRLLAAMVPRDDQVWFFKVVGPVSAIDSIEDRYREFIAAVAFDDDGPVLDELPDNWRRGGDKPFRFASLDVETPNKQLDISISKLARLDDYDAMVAMNVNRWRRQLGLSEISGGGETDQWAGGQPIEIATADGPAVWVDMTGSAEAAVAAPVSRTPPPSTRTAEEGESESPIRYERPAGWRDSRRSTMRLAAFEVGPEPASDDDPRPAVITVIPAGGDLRGNVARWLGQALAAQPDDETVDAALASAQNVVVDGRPGQRFFLSGEDAELAIDATIVPLRDEFSLFIKMTGPKSIVTAESDRIAAFLQSLTFDL